MVLAVGDCVQFREEVQATLEDLLQGQKETQAEVTKILDCSTAREAQQLLLVHQVLLDLVIPHYYVFHFYFARLKSAHCY